MKQLRRIVFVLTTTLLAASPLAHAQTVTLPSLLAEMTDCDAVARFPQPRYESLQASSYNRASTNRNQPNQDTSGWFADSDGLGFIRTETNHGQKEWVIMEHQSPGCITKIWTPFFYYGFNDRVGPNVRIYLDGSDTPAIDESLINLVTALGSVHPPFATYTARAGDLYLPIPFAKSCKVTMAAKPFYNIINYRAYPEGTKVEPFTRAGYQAAAADLEKAGKALTTQPDANQGAIRKSAQLKPGDSMEIPLPAGPNAVRQFTVRLPGAAAHPASLRSTVLAMTFDGEETVWCPLGDFFCSADSLHPIHTWQRTVSADGTMVCRWVMPYRSTAELRVLNLGSQPMEIALQADSVRWDWDERSMLFHTNWRPDDVVPGTPFQDWNYIDIRGQGVFVGDAWTVLNIQGSWWGEGDEKIYVDGAWDKGFPTHFGTGTEDYYGWAGGEVPTRKDEFSVPFLANARVGGLDGRTTGFNICTRTRSLDAIPFTQRLVFDMESSFGTDIRNPWNLLGYSAVTVWYARPGARHNRPALPEVAARPIMSLATVKAKADAIRAPVQTQPPQSAARGLVERLLPKHAKSFVLEIIPRDPGGDVFEIETQGGQVILRGNNGVSLASALNWYLKYHCGCHHSLTGGSQLRLPEPLPQVAPKVRRVSSARHRYFLNYCCFGYSLPWYDWPQWERLIDWMALNGVNLPLSVTGQEAVWQAVGRRLGWSEQGVQAFLAGPPYLPFGWMGCLDGHGGPLPATWIDRHAELEKKILERQRALGMTPVLQGFTGHVPATITNQSPTARLQKITWLEWNTFVLDPLDPLFPRIAAAFLEEQHKIFGTDHFYAADTFIEMIPPSGDTNYLAAIGRAIFDGMCQTDPEAVWVLQGWPFFYARSFWTQPRIEAVLRPVPDTQSLLLDLYCEKTPVWSQTKAFCGKPWLWCNIQNFGNRVWLGGALDRIDHDFWAAHNDPQAGRLSGLGFVNEGLDNNPVVFDLLFELAWRNEPVPLDSWLSDFCRRAYGKPDPHAVKAWQALHETAFQAAFDNGAAYTLAPSLGAPRATPYNNDRLAEGWQHLLAAADDLRDADPFRFDLVNVARQVLGNYSAELHRQVNDAFKNKNREALQQASAKMLTLLRDLDALLATRNEFLLGNWLEDARRWGATDAERDRLEWNARRVLTLWGNGTVLRDYACRQWSGLLDGFYLKRWEIFFHHLDQALAGGMPFDEKAFAAEMFEFEKRWADLHDRPSRYPRGDSIEAARQLWAKYGDAFRPAKK